MENIKKTNPFLVEKVDSLQIERMTDGKKTSNFNTRRIKKGRLVMLLIVEVYSL